jgi:hypothetical protein
MQEINRKKCAMGGILVVDSGSVGHLFFVG